MLRRVSSRPLAASSSSRTWSARRWRMATMSRDGSASACRVRASMRSRWPRRIASSAAPSLRRACSRPASAASKAARMTASVAARTSSVSTISGASRTPRKASRPSALAGATPNSSTRRPASPARTFRNSSLTTGCVCWPACTTVSVACTLPRENRFCTVWRAGCSIRSNPGGRRRRASRPFPLTDLTSHAIAAPFSSALARAKPVILCSAMPVRPFEHDRGPRACGAPQRTGIRVGRDLQTHRKDHAAKQ